MRYRRVVAKFGTSLLTAGSDRLDLVAMSQLVGQVMRLRGAGCEVAVVSSGARAAGRHALARRPAGAREPSRQSFASAGQSRLMQSWDELFQWHDAVVAQVLLTRRDLSDRLGYLNARNTLRDLLDCGAVPIVNENDAVALDEVLASRIGENDSLSAFVANLIDADLLVILTDVDGLHTADPSRDPDAELIAEVTAIDERHERAAGGGAGLGGMEAKLSAARVAAQGGATVVIANGRAPDALVAAAAGEHSAFTGWSGIAGDATAAAILRAGRPADVLPEGAEGAVVLDATPFYPEGGGQLGDRGLLRASGGLFAVEDTRAEGGAILHHGRVRAGELRAGDSLRAEVDPVWRGGAARNHTATHLLHAGLRAVLGQHVRQQGSLVASDRLRFDFTHLERAPRAALDEVEALVNETVRRDAPVEWRMTSYREAIDGGALAFFGDTYGSEVRVVEIGVAGVLASAELCGGTHVGRTGELGIVHVLRESAVAAGTRRIEALSGASAERFLLEQHARLRRLAERLGAPPAALEERIEGLRAELEELRGKVAALERARAAGQGEDLAAAAERVGGANLLVARVGAPSRPALKELADDLRRRLAPALLVLAAVIDDRPAFLVAATPDLVAAGVHAGDIVRAVATAAGGGGGGRPDLAEAGARDPSALDAALEEGRRRAVAALADGEGGAA